MKVYVCIVAFFMIVASTSSLFANDAVYQAQHQNKDISVQVYLKALPIYNQGLATHSKAHLEEALKLLHQAYSSNRYFFEVVQALSRIYFLLRENEKARQFANEVLLLRVNDFSSRVLIANIDIQENNNLVAVGTELIALEQINQYDKGLILTQILYYSAIGNFRQINRYLLLFRQVYPEQAKILNIHTIIDVLAKQKNTAAGAQAAEALFSNNKDDLYVVWILSEYYYLFDTSQRLTRLLNTLLQSGYPLLEKSAFQKSLSLSIVSDIDIAVGIAQQYTQRYPLEEDAWFYLGYTHYLNGAYLDASIAFKQGYEIQKNDDFLLFMYDIALRDGREALATIRDLRVTRLSDIAENAILQGNIMQAKIASRRALLIHPLAERPLFLLANIYQSEGYIDKANVLFSLLKDRENSTSTASTSVNKELNYLLESNTEALRESLQDLQITNSQGFTIYPWNIEIKNASTKALGKSKFLRDLIVYTLSQYEVVNVENVMYAQSKNQLQKEEYELVFDYFDNLTQFRVEATLFEKRTLDSIFTFSANGYGNDRIIDAMQLLSNKIANSLPVLSKFSFIDKDTFFLSAGENIGVMKDALLPIYNRSYFKLKKDDPYISITSESFIGFAALSEVYPTFSIGSITNTDGTAQKVDAFNLLQNFDTNDIVVIPPRSLDFEDTGNTKGQFQQRQKNLIFSSLYYTMLFNIW